MPYILVDIIMGFISLGYFSITTAALLARRWPKRRLVAFVALTVVLFGASYGLAHIAARTRQTFLFSPWLFDILFFVALINTVMLAYQFLSKRYFLNIATLQRRLLIGTISVVVTGVPALAVVIAVFGMFVIR